MARVHSLQIKVFIFFGECALLNHQKRFPLAKWSRGLIGVSGLICGLNWACKTFLRHTMSGPISATVDRS